MGYYHLKVNVKKYVKNILKSTSKLNLKIQTLIYFFWLIRVTNGAQGGIIILRINLRYNCSNANFTTS